MAVALSTQEPVADATVRGAGRDAAVSAEPPTYNPRRFWERRLRASFDLDAAGFRGLGKPFNQALYQQRHTVLYRAFRRYAIKPRGADVLELGPGTGFYIPIWQRLGVRRLTGFDIAPVSVERLRARFPSYDFRRADIGAPWNLPSESFDIITAFDVLFHIVDDGNFETAISEAARTVRPGGHFLVSDLFPHGDRYSVFHQTSRRLGEYETVLNAHGFTILGRLPIFVAMHPPHDLAPGLRRDLAWRWWTWLDGTVRRNPEGAGRLGTWLGRFDRVVTRLLRDGPSVELLVAQRR